MSATRPISAICSELKADADVSAIVGDRIFDEFGDGSAQNPCIFVTIPPGGEHPHHLLGATGKVRSVVQVDIYATTPSQRDDLTEKVRLALDSIIDGTVGNAPNDLAVRSVMLDGDPFTGYEQPRAGESPTERRCTMTFNVWYGEAIPSHA